MTDSQNQDSNELDIQSAIQRFSEEMHIDADMYKKILQSTVDTTVPDLPKLEQAIDAGDFETIQAISHRLKGTFLNLRLENIAAPMVEIDALSKAREGLEAMKPHLEKFNGLFQILKSALE